MKGHMQDGRFHPHTQYKKVTRKAREPFPVKSTGVKIPQRTLAQMQRDAGVRGKRIEPDKGWQGMALSTKQLEEMFKHCNSNFADNGEAGHNAILNTYTGSATSHVHGRTSCEEYKGYCYYCGLNINALEEKQLAEQNIRKERTELPEPILDTGLDDIFDDVRQTDPEFVKRYGDDKIDDSKLTKAVGDNIIFILKREKRLKNDEHISVGNINFREETEDDSGHYQYDYSIWKNNPLTLTNKGGTAYGMISNGTLIDMKLELYNTDEIR